MKELTDIQLDIAYDILEPVFQELAKDVANKPKPKTMELNDDE